MTLDRARNALLVAAVLALAACSRPGVDCVPVEAATASVEEGSAGAIDGVSPSVPEGIDGLTATVIREGRAAAVGPGDVASMHYTGWLYDPAAADGRGKQFDTSRDRGQTFQFPLGGGRVIRGWDLGVAGMQLGEVRELLIAPELGYGSRGAGDVIPPDATLLFEVELVSFKRCATYE